MNVFTIIGQGLHIPYYFVVLETDIELGIVMVTLVEDWLSST